MTAKHRARRAWSAAEEASAQPAAVGQQRKFDEPTEFVSKQSFDEVSEGASNP